MNNLERLTIVIPTYNRKEYALRAMRFWNDKDVQVHFMDGSDEPIEENELKFLSPNILYHYGPNDLYKRIYKSVDLVKTDFAALLSDDEFFIPESIDLCIKELDENSDLVSCVGEVFGFNIRKGKVLGFPVYGGFVDYKVDSTDPLERMNFHMNQKYLQTTLYAVSRTGPWKKVIKSIFSKEFSAYAMWEIQFESAIHIFGKSKVIPHLMWLRSREGLPTRGTSPSMSSEYLFYDWWVDRSKVEQKSEFLDRYVKLFTEKHGHSDHVREGIKKIFSQYSTNYQVTLESIIALKAIKNKWYWRVIHSFLDLFPNFRYLLKGILKIDRKKDPVKMKKAISNLENTGVKVNHSELDEILDLISNLELQRAN